MPECSPDAEYKKMQAATEAAKRQPTTGAFQQEKLAGAPVETQLRKDVDPSRDMPTR
ncbi:MAG TPA: hypothetical protein VFG04_02935 [Planctomycetaceae bacterium]|jgi:hypothetical protein|nr:hypothetical protein [Planctomycetaceae bacterium]